MKPFKAWNTEIFQYSLIIGKCLSAFSVALLLILPNFIWIVLDKGVWRGDPVGYALGSVALYQKLIQNPCVWVRHLFGGYKGPFILWVGQFFVGLGNFIGSINFALLLIPLIATFITFMLLFRSFELLFKNKAIALCGCLTVAASPLLNSVSTGFWVEPIQLAITSWFIYAMVRAGSWSFYFALSQFIIAGSLAMLIKLSSPLYIVGPAVAFWIIVFKGSPSMRVNRKDFLFLLTSVLFFLPTAVFYFHNLAAILGFAHFAATSPLFGGELSKFDLWIEYISNGVFLHTTFSLVILLLLLGLIKTIKQQALGNFGGVFVIALFQMAVFFIAWVTSPNEDSRYMLPVVPYFAMLICWSLATISNRIFTLTSVTLFIIQFAFVIGFTFRLTQLGHSCVNIRPLIKKHDKEMQLINDLMPLATRDSSIIFDLDPGFGLASFQYELAKQDINGNWSRCCVDVNAFLNIERQEIDTGKINIEIAWKNILAYNPDFYITWNSRLSSALAQVEIREIDKYTAATVPARWKIADKMKNYTLYEVVAFPDYPELLVYKRCDIPAKKIPKTLLLQSYYGVNP